MRVISLVSSKRGPHHGGGREVQKCNEKVERGIETIKADHDYQAKMARANDEEEKVDLAAAGVARSIEAHSHFAGRAPAGSRLPICISKDGVNHVLQKDGEAKKVLSIGLACSEVFSGPRLAELLRPGFEYEARILSDLASGRPAAPLSIHTSGGVHAALSNFVNALEPHLPWKQMVSEDWCVSLQLEGASAVWAGIDMLLQLQALGDGTDRTKVAVGARSYHGPPSTSFGSSCPLFTKHAQVTYPVPMAGEELDERQMLKAFERFLEEHGDEIGVLLIEPQWGSSQAGLPWPRDLVRAYVRRAQERGILVLADEIMCGLGRHGQGTLFLSEAWGLNPNAVTFGKAIGGGVFPLSGAIIKTGGALLGSNGRAAMQSHTFAGSSVRALMAGVEVLNTLPLYFDSIKKLGDECKVIFRHLEKISNGLICAQGQGLMWGALVSRDGMHKDGSVRVKTVARLRRNFEAAGVVPYFVPVGGFMVSPVIDIDVGTLYAAAEKMERALAKTAREVGWIRPEVPRGEAEPGIKVTLHLDDEFCASEVSGRCLSHLHFSRTCTSCGMFVRPEIRRRFFRGLLEQESCAKLSIDS